jgi:ComEC/Rec2-related protein
MEPTVALEKAVAPFHERMWRKSLRSCQKRPLLTLGWLTVLTVLITDNGYLHPGLGTWLMAAAALGLGVWKRRWWAFIPFVILLFICMHGRRLQQTYEHPLRKHLLSQPERPVEVHLTGRLYPWAEGAELDAARAICAVSALRWGEAGEYEPMEVQVQVFLPNDFHLELAGSYQITGFISLPKKPMNPGQYDAVDYGLRSGWVARVQAQTITLKAAEWSATFHLLNWAEKSRRWIISTLSRGIEDRPEDNAVLLAMALGASDAAGDDIEDAFRDSGTLHIFAVSGLHVVMLAFVLSMGLRWLGLGKSRSTFLLIFIVFAYAYITGWCPSAARAAFMIAIVMAALHRNRRADLQNSLGFAVIVLLLWDTHQLFQPGFQLSFLVLWSIAVFAAPMLARLKPWTELDPFFPPTLASWSHWVGCLDRQLTTDDRTLSHRYSGGFAGKFTSRATFRNQHRHLLCESVGRLGRVQLTSNLRELAECLDGSLDGHVRELVRGFSWGECHAGPAFWESATAHADACFSHSWGWLRRVSMCAGSALAHRYGQCPPVAQHPASVPAGAWCQFPGSAAADSW